MNDSVKAPWTQDVVDNLNRYQSSNFYHPFTCGSGNRMDDNHFDGGVLVAIINGWICPSCQYTQDWCHSFMTEFTEAIYLEQKAKRDNFWR